MDISKNAISHNWYALYTKSRTEKKVYDELQKMGIEAYLPVRKTLSVWTDRKKWIETPIISSYVFVHVQPKDFFNVYEVNGVVSYVTKNKKPATIPEQEIKAMQQAVNSNVTLNVEADTIVKGQKVTITSGPLRGITGEVVEIQGVKKFYMRISHIGYMLVVDLNENEETEAQ